MLLLWLLEYRFLNELLVVGIPFLPKLLVMLLLLSLFLYGSHCPVILFLLNDLVNLLKLAVEVLCLGR